MMADVQLEHGFIRIANDLFDEILRRDFSKRQTSILFFILRMSYGCKRKLARIEHLTDFELCGVDRSAISKELENLEAARVITHDFLKKEFQINKDFDQWAVSYCRCLHIKKGHRRWAELVAENIDLSLYETSSTLQNNTGPRFIKNSQTLDKKTSECSLSLMKDMKDNNKKLDKISSEEEDVDLLNLIGSKIPYSVGSLQTDQLIDLEERLTPRVACQEFKVCVEWYQSKRGRLPLPGQIISWLEKSVVAKCNDIESQQAAYDNLEDMRPPSGRQTVNVNKMLEEQAKSKTQGK